MLLFELFDADGGSVMNGLRQAALDYLTPMASSNVRFVTMQNVIDNLSELRSGLSIDRGLIMQLLDPQQNQLVKKIEGDRVYIGMPEPDRADSDDDKMKDAEKVHNHAQDQAQKAVANSGGPNL